MIDQLLDPPFARNPAFRADAKIVGIVLAILAGLGLLLILVALPVVLFAVALVPLVALGFIASLAGAALTVYGGYQMYRGNADGKRWVIYGLIIYAIGDILGLLSGDLSQIVGLAILAVVYYVVVTSRYTTETRPPTAPPTP